MIALIGGSFDPIHTGHVHLALEVIRRYRSRKLFLIPAYINPLKGTPTGATAGQRLMMTRLAVAEMGEPAIEVLDHEVTKPGPSYSVDTIDFVGRKEQDSILFVLGNEIFPSLPDWERPRELLLSADIAVATRVGSSVDIELTLRRAGLKEMRSFENGRRVEHSGARFVETFPIAALPFSSTGIRLEISQHASLQQNWMPQGIQRSVWQYIKENQLYAVR